MKLWWRGEPLSGCSLVSKQEMMCGERSERERKEEIKKKISQVRQIKFC
jgi:hypothetical protein